MVGDALTITDYIRTLRQHWPWVLLSAVLATVGGFLYSLAITPTYEAKAQVFVSTQGGGAISDLTQGSTFTQQRVKSYVDLSSSPRLLQPVIDTLRLTTTPQALASQVKATSPLDTVLINVAVTDTNPSRARDIANAVADAYPKLVAELETPPDEAKSPVNVSRKDSHHPNSARLATPAAQLDAWVAIGARSWRRSGCHARHPRQDHQVQGRRPGHSRGARNDDGRRGRRGH